MRRSGDTTRGDTRGCAPAHPRTTPGRGRGGRGRPEGTSRGEGGTRTRPPAAARGAGPPTAGPSARCRPNPARILPRHGEGARRPASRRTGDLGEPAVAASVLINSSASWNASRRRVDRRRTPSGPTGGALYTSAARKGSTRSTGTGTGGWARVHREARRPCERAVAAGSMITLGARMIPYEQAPDPHPGPGEIRVRVAVGGPGPPCPRPGARPSLSSAAPGCAVAAAVLSVWRGRRGRSRGRPGTRRARGVGSARGRDGPTTSCGIDQARRARSRVYVAKPKVGRISRDLRQRPR